MKRICMLLYIISQYYITSYSLHYSKPWHLRFISYKPCYITPAIKL